MGEVTRDGAGMTIGVDLGDRYSQLCVLDERGEVCEESRIATTERAMRKRFEGMARCRVVMPQGQETAPIVRVGLPPGVVSWPPAFRALTM